MTVTYPLDFGAGAKDNLRRSKELLGLAVPGYCQCFSMNVTEQKHLSVDLSTTDETLFTMVKVEYHEETSRLRRFFAMRGVKKISYVKVRIKHTVMSPIQMEI